MSTFHFRSYKLYDPNHSLTHCSVCLRKFSTCFNRIDLPIYDTKDELREKLKIAVATSATGFDIE